MDLHQDGPAVALQALDDPALPQRTIPVQTAFQYAGDRPKQLGVVAGTRDSDAPQVPGQIEVWIVDPLGRADVKVLAAQHLSAPRYGPDAVSQNGFQLPVIRSCTLDDGDAADRQAHVPV